MLIFKS